MSVTTAAASRTPAEALRPYVPQLLVDWLGNHPERTHRAVDGTLLFADISGFTQLTERLARRGRVGAEEMSDALDATFGELLEVARRDAADLVKWGGDAVLLLFEGESHAARACRAAHGMRARLATVGNLSTGAGRVRLRMSQGVHSGRFHFFLVGDPGLHRELLVCGPGVSEVVGIEAVARAGDVALSRSTQALLASALLGTELADGVRLLRRAPDLDDAQRLPRPATEVDLSVGLSASIRRRLLASDRQPEHRAIAVGFVAYSGSDAMLAERGPESTARALDEMIRNVTDAAARHEVTFFESDINRDGGKIMLTAGAPVSAGHDAERMLRAARLIVERSGRLPLRVGVNMGPVFAGDFGPPFRRTYSVKGDAINLAARLVARAEPGQVLATAVVPEHSASGFVTSPLEPFHVKGKSRPVQAVDVGPLHASSTGAAGRVTTGRLVGRDAEMAVLRGELEAARAGSGSLVQILGESGIGKSRVVSELAASAEDVPVFSVSCDEYESATPYHSLGMLLADVLGIPDRTDALLLHRRLSERVAADAPDLEVWLPLLGTVLGLAIPDNERTEGLGDEFRRARLEQVVADLLHAVLPTAALIAFDDAHLMDSASVAVLETVARRIGTEPWLLVVAARGEGPGPLAAADPTVLRPRPLGPEDSRRLLRGATAEHPLPLPVLDALVRRSAGNPLFLESLVHAAQLGEPGDSGELLPETVEDLVTAQVDRLLPADRTVLRFATVFGMRFEADELARLVRGHAPEPDAETFRRLAEFLVPERGALRFRHALIREVAYRGLPFRTRRALHNRVARTLERIDPDGSPELLSYHFFQAGRFDRSWRYSTQAAARARAKYANHEAIELLNRAVESHRRGLRGALAPDELGAVHEGLGDLWFLMGLPDRAATAYRQAKRQLHDDPVGEARVVTKQARVDQHLRKLPQSLRRVGLALHRLEGVSGQSAHAARALLSMRYAIGRFSQGRVVEALRWGSLAATEAEEAVDQVTLAQTYSNLHGLYLGAGRLPPLPYGELALRAFTELGNLALQADCTNNLAIEALDHNRWVEAARRYGEAATMYRTIGDTQGEGIAVFNRAEVLVRQGHLDLADGLLQDALWAARSVSDEELVAMVLRELGRMAARRGQTEDALAQLAGAREKFAELDQPGEVVGVDVVTCEALGLGGDPRAALELSERVLASGETAAIATIRRIRGLVLVEQGERDLARGEFEAGVAAAATQDDDYGRALNLLGLASVGAGSGDEHTEEAERMLTALGVVAVPTPGGGQLNRILAS